MRARWTWMILLALPAAAWSATPEIVRGLNQETLITLHAADASPESVFADLATQSGVSIRGRTPTFWATVNTKISVDIDKNPFWEAMRQLCMTAGVSPLITATTGEILLGRSEKDKEWFQRAVCTGPFMVTVDSVRHLSAISYGDTNDVSNTLSVQLNRFVDPNVRVISIMSEMTFSEVVDDKGNSLIPEKPKADPDAPSDTAANVNGARTARASDLLIRLTYPPKNRGIRIAKMKGSFTAVIQTKSQIVEFADAAHPSEAIQTVGDYRVTLGEVKPGAASRLTVKINIQHVKEAPEGNRFDDMPVARTAKLTDAQGHDLLLQSSNGSGRGGDFVLGFARNAGGRRDTSALEPGKLTLEIPLETKTLEVPVEFSDLALP